MIYFSFIWLNVFWNCQWIVLNEQKNSIINEMWPMLVNFFKKNPVLVNHSSHCDQMARLFYQYLVICKNEKLPCIKGDQTRFKSFSEYLLTLKKLPKTFKIFPNRWNFAQSGHTDSSHPPDNHQIPIFDEDHFRSERIIFLRRASNAENDTTTLFIPRSQKSVN